MNDKSGFPLSGVNRQLSFAIALIFMNSEGPSIRIDNPRRQLGNNDGFDHVVRVWPESTVSRLSTDAPRFVDALHIGAYNICTHFYYVIRRVISKSIHSDSPRQTWLRQLHDWLGEGCHDYPYSHGMAGHSGFTWIY